MSQDRPKSKGLDASKYAFAIVASRFNCELVDALVKDVENTLKSHGARDGAIRIVRVPGAGEVPFAAKKLAVMYSAVIGLGVVIAGDTPHHLVIANSTASALQDISVFTDTPMINGIIVANNREQAEARTIGKIKRGAEFAECAIEMASLNAGIEADLTAIDMALDDEDDGDWSIDIDDDDDK